MSQPTRRITTENDLKIFQDSNEYDELVTFVEDLQNLVAGLPNDTDVHVSTTVKALIDMLEEIDGIISTHPVIQDKDTSRFGKVEFKDFYDDLQRNSKRLVTAVLETKNRSEGHKTVEDQSTKDQSTKDQSTKDQSTKDQSIKNQSTKDQSIKNQSDYSTKDQSIASVTDLATYLTESWGNRTRIDYGSGHELNFICFLLCLKKLDIITKDDYSLIILKVFTKYISIMRNLQKTYWLEPAGSHGVWGLDDYHFLPFLFGASQLSTHPHMKPKLIHNEELVEMFYKQYMYLECINFINNIKTLPANQEGKLSLRWHSPMLDDILLAKSWLKIKEGMVKMYKAEVLSKLPIMQHFLFGLLIRCPDGIEEPHETEECGHIHAVNTWGDCCGIKIPSAIAASESIKREKVVPFD